VTLIGSYNNFLLAWFRECNDLNEAELDYLFDVARRTAEEVGWDVNDVRYPGNWQFELTDLLESADRWN
jgi:hypothetical protein